MTKLAIQ